jgi:serine/threonine-protein kinase
MVTLAEGRIFADRYRVVRCLAAGGMGAVYEAVHIETERRRALKVMHPHLFQSEEMRERFKREARIAAHVESEYIVDVSDAGVDEATGTPFLVMELLRGEDLGDRLKRSGRLPPDEALTYLRQTALALDRTHARAIVHRDLKPENIFVTRREDGSPAIKILDFGVAKLVAEGATGAGTTRSLGTPLYMAPEQFRTSSKITPAADIHALGMMAYTLLVGEPYWAREARDAADVIAFALTAVYGPKEPATARSAASGVVLPPSFDPWFARVTAVEPAHRFPTATEAIRTLGEALGTAGVSGVRRAMVSAATADTLLPTSTGTTLVPARAERRRSPLVVAAGMAAVVALGAAAAWLALRSSPGAPAVAAVAAGSGIPTTIATTSPVVAAEPTAPSGGSPPWSGPEPRAPIATVTPTATARPPATPRPASASKERAAKTPAPRAPAGNAGSIFGQD